MVWWYTEKREAFQQILNQSASVALIQTQTGLRMPVSAVKVLRCVRPPPSPTSSLWSHESAASFKQNVASEHNPASDYIRHSNWGKQFSKVET